MDVWTATFVAFGLLSQVGLLLYFAARRWRPDAERRWGWVMYALGVPAAGLALVGLGTAAPPEHILAYVLFAAWAGFGALVDLRLRIEWRSPIRPPIFGAVRRIVRGRPVRVLDPALVDQRGGVDRLRRGVRRADDVQRAGPPRGLTKARHARAIGVAPLAGGYSGWAMTRIRISVMSSIA